MKEKRGWISLKLDEFQIPKLFQIGTRIHVGRPTHSHTQTNDGHAWEKKKNLRRISYTGY